MSIVTFVLAGMALLFGIVALLETDIGSGCAEIGCGLVFAAIVGSTLLAFLVIFGFGCAAFVS